jgi:glycosyl transferase family 25
MNIDDEIIEIDKRLSVEKSNTNHPTLIDIYVINLASRPDRLAHVKKSFEQLDFVNLIKFEAYNKIPGYVGCSKSHQALIRWAQFKNLNWIFIINDDCELLPTISNLEYLNILSTLINSHTKWEIFNGNLTFVNNVDLNLNLNPLMKTKSSVSKEFYFINGGLTTNFVGYTNKAYSKMINDFDPYGQLAIDQFISCNFRILSWYKYISTQSESWSDIENKLINYTGEINEWEKFYIGLIQLDQELPEIN